MYKVLTFFTIFSLLLNFSGCANKINQFEIGEISKVEVSDNGVDLLVESDSITRTCATLVMENNSQNDVLYGEPYEIEIKIDDNWHKINVVINFVESLYLLKVNKSNGFNLEWNHTYGELPSGTYRIIKEFQIDNVTDDEITETFYSSAEFIIE